MRPMRHAERGKARAVGQLLAAAVSLSCAAGAGGGASRRRRRATACRRSSGFGRQRRRRWGSSRRGASSGSCPSGSSRSWSVTPAKGPATETNGVEPTLIRATPRGPLGGRGPDRPLGAGHPGAGDAARGPVAGPLDARRSNRPGPNWKSGRRPTAGCLSGSTAPGSSRRPFRGRSGPVVARRAGRSTSTCRPSS